ncbi:PrpF protein [Daedaleopsis nitida]|nr:PrpF protein [Daedaleopsis nitida]
MLLARTCRRVPHWRNPCNPMQTRSLALSQVANPLPATFMRGGTSKGIFLRRSDLPDSPVEWTPIFQGIMGSPDPDYRRQLNGMGGGVSSLSKICVVGPPTSPDRGADVEYTFVQVGIEDGLLDLSGNCGNLSSMIGVFALDEGLCSPRDVNRNTGLATVRSYNTNTSKLIDTTLPLSPFSMSADLDRPEVAMAGVPGQASKIMLQFVNPGGARTGKLLPTGSPIDDIEFAEGANKVTIPASLVDATNPTVFVAAEHLAPLLGITAQALTAKHFTRPDVESKLEAIRQAAAVRMGLDPSAKAQPKIAVLSEPAPSAGGDEGVDIDVHAFSMGVMHKAVPMTVGLCLGVAAGVEGTLAHSIVRCTRRTKAVTQDELVRIRHPGGTVDVGAQFDADGTVTNAQVVRTGRRLMKGVVWW